MRSPTMRYSLPETIVSPLAPRPIGELLPEVLARYGIEPAPVGENGSATQKNNLRRQATPIQAAPKRDLLERESAGDWRPRRGESKLAKPSRQLRLFSTTSERARNR